MHQTFVAYNFMYLPPLKMDSMDCLRVIRGLEAVRGQIKYISSSQLELVNYVWRVFARPHIEYSSTHAQSSSGAKFSSEHLASEVKGIQTCQQTHTSGGAQT